MPIQTNEYTSERKSIDVTVTPSATGVSIAGTVRWFDTLYTIPPTTIPCVYVDDETYRVVLASSPPRPVLVESGTTIPDEVCYLARWTFAAPTDTCATVAIEVPKRTLVPRIGDDGQPVTLPAPTPVTVSTTPVLPAASVEKARGRKRAKRIRVLTQQARDLRGAGTTYGAMTAAQRQAIGELVALLADVPMELP